MEYHTSCNTFWWSLKSINTKLYVIQGTIIENIVIVTVYVPACYIVYIDYAYFVAHKFLHTDMYQII